MTLHVPYSAHVFTLLPRSVNYNNYVSLDLETTGLDPNTCDIIEVAMVKVREGEIVDRMETFVFTPLEISEHVSYLTGISAADIEGGPDFVDLIQQIQEFIGDDPLMGHNIWFDWNFLTQKGVHLENNQLWDTYILSNILYPELPSHSLETNTKYFDIAHEDSHRAMADVIACYELWKILMETFPNITSQQREKIAELKNKTDWPLIDFFLEDRPASKHNLHVPSSGQYVCQPLTDLQLPDSAPLMIHGPGKDPVNIATGLEKSGKTLYVAGYEHTRNKLKKAFPDALILESPYSYIDPDKLKSLQEKESLEAGEASLILKTILHSPSSSQQELVLSHPERQVWRAINTNPQEVKETTSVYNEIYQQSLEADTVICSQDHVLSDLEYVAHFDQLVMLEPQMLEDNATKCFGRQMTAEDWQAQSTEEEWSQKGDLFFAQLEQLGNQLVPSSQYPEHIILTQMLIESNEFIRLRSAVKEMVDSTDHPERQSYLKYFQAFFNIGDNTWIRWITVDPRRGTRLNIAPLSTKALLNKHLLTKTKATIISDSSPTFAFLPEMETLELRKEGSISVVLPELSEITGMKREGDHQALMSYLSEQLPQQQGNTAVIFSSKSALKRYFFDIAKVIPEDILMMGEDISGGTGKFRDRYLTSEKKNKVVFMSYRNLRSFPPEQLDFDTIFLQSFPFDPPGLPTHQARSAQVANGFMDYSLPRSQQYLLEIVSNFSHREGERRLIVLDRRAQEKAYGGDLLSVIEQ